MRILLIALSLLLSGPLLEDGHAAGKKKFYELDGQARRDVDMLVASAIRAGVIADLCGDYRLDVMKLKSGLWRLQKKHKLTTPQLNHIAATVGKSHKVNQEIRWFASQGLKKAGGNKQFCVFGRRQIQRRTAIGQYLKKR